MIRIIDMTDATSSDEFEFAIWNTVNGEFFRTWTSTWTVKDFEEDEGFDEDFKQRCRRRINYLAQGGRDMDLIAEMLAALKASQNTSSNLRKQVADLLAALKLSRKFIGAYFAVIEYDELVIANKLGLSELQKKTQQAIADAEAARKSPLHPCDVELPEHDDLPSIAYEELPEGDTK